MKKKNHSVLIKQSFRNDKIDCRLSGRGFNAYNKPKLTPNHHTYRYMVIAKEDDQVKTIRFNKCNKCSEIACDNVKKSKLSANYWSHKIL